MIKRIVIFLVLNFAALGVGSYFTGPGVSSDWYQNLNQAPWTPPGWVFGAAWTTIMLCFSVYMAYLYENTRLKKEILTLFAFQWLLNVLWNPVFFYFQNVILGLIIITSLTVIVYTFLLKYWSFLNKKSLLVLPYAVWLTIAASLNAYVFFFN